MNVGTKSSVGDMDVMFNLHPLQLTMHCFNILSTAVFEGGTTQLEVFRVMLTNNMNLHIIPFISNVHKHIFNTFLVSKAI